MKLLWGLQWGSSCWSINQRDASTFSPVCAAVAAHRGRAERVGMRDLATRPRHPNIVTILKFWCSVTNTLVISHVCPYMMADWDRETRQVQASGMPSSSCRLPESFSDTQPVAARPVRLYLLSLAVDERPHITDEKPFFQNPFCWNLICPTTYSHSSSVVAFRHST
jgi:hypothetical protein